MLHGKPSRTALAAAAHRAAHQVIEDGRIFNAPLAVRIVGRDRVAQDAEQDPVNRRMRLFIAVRTRFAEDACAIAIGNGVRQIVVLGVGLGTYAYRTTPSAGVSIFEVDHPATHPPESERRRLDESSTVYGDCSAGALLPKQ